MRRWRRKARRVAGAGVGAGAARVISNWCFIVRLSFEAAYVAGWDNRCLCPNELSERPLRNLSGIFLPPQISAAQSPARAAAILLSPPLGAPPRLMLLAFHKPYGVLSQFTPEPGSQFRTLADFGFPQAVYPIGRLDADSEGLLLLSDEAELNERLLHPRHAHEREYWVQVERVPAAEALGKLEPGLVIQGHPTLPCRARMLDPQPQMPPRDPPIRVRKNVPDCWLSLELIEGKNRQVRRMTAAIGHPTLRLLRVRIGGFRLQELAAGTWRELAAAERQQVFGN